MDSDRSKSFKKVFGEFEKHGLLLVSDSRFPSVSGLVAGEPVRGSWWDHPAGRAIFRVASELGDHPDVVVTKLVSGKVTFVHRNLWPDLFAVATSRERWQTRNLPVQALRILKAVERGGATKGDQIRNSLSIPSPEFGKAVTALEKKLLVRSEEVHTESGAHARQLETWHNWANRIGFRPEKIVPEQARNHLSKVLLELNRRFESKGTLPWEE